MLAIVPLVVNGALMPGQSVRVTLRVQPDEPVIVVPLSAIEYEGETAVVFIRGEVVRPGLPDCSAAHG